MDPSHRHLVTRLDVLIRVVQAAVHQRQQGDPDPGDPFRGMHISAEQAQRLLDSRVGLGDAGLEIRDIAEAVEREALDAAEKGHPIRLHQAADAFLLDSLDVGVLLVAIAPDLDPRMERAYGYLHDDLTRRRASIGLALELCGAHIHDAGAWTRLSDGGPLVRHGLLEVEDRDRPFLTRSLRVPDAVTAFLLGDDSVDPVVTPHVEHLLGRSRADSSTIETALAAGVTLVHVHDRSGVGAVSWAAAGSTAAGLEPLVLDLGRVAAAEDPARVIAAARRHTILAGGSLLVSPLEALAAHGPAVLRQLTAPGAIVISIDTRPWDPTWSERVPLSLSAPPTSGVPSGGSAYRLTPEQEDRAGQAARLLAVSEGSETDTGPFRRRRAGAERRRASNGSRSGSSRERRGTTSSFRPTSWRNSGR